MLWISKYLHRKCINANLTVKYQKNQDSLIKELKKQNT